MLLLRLIDFLLAISIQFCKPSARKGGLVVCDSGELGSIPTTGFTCNLGLPLTVMGIGYLTPSGSVEDPSLCKMGIIMLPNLCLLFHFFTTSFLGKGLSPPLCVTSTFHKGVLILIETCRCYSNTNNGNKQAFSIRGSSAFE